MEDSPSALLAPARPDLDPVLPHNAAGLDDELAAWSVGRVADLVDRESTQGE